MSNSNNLQEMKCLGLPYLNYIWTFFHVPSLKRVYSNWTLLMVKCYLKTRFEPFPFLYSDLVSLKRYNHEMFIFNVWTMPSLLTKQEVRVVEISSVRQTKLPAYALITLCVMMAKVATSTLARVRHELYCHWISRFADG